MNKKFSTLCTSALLMVGAVFGTANAQEDATVDFAKLTGDYYYITDGSHYLEAEEIEVAAKKATYTSVKATQTLNKDLDFNLFKITKVDRGAGVVYFTLTNKETGAAVSFIQDAVTKKASFITTADAKDAVYTNFFDMSSDVFTATDKKVSKTNKIALLPKFGVVSDNDQQLVVNGSQLFIQLNNPLNKNFYFESVSEVSLTAKKLNESLKNGFLFETDKIENEDNIFASQKIKAFNVTKAIDIREGYTVPKGLYFAISYPEELAEVDVNVIDNYDDFTKCTFIALDPVNTVGTPKDSDKAAGKDFGFKTVSGDDFNFYTETRTNKYDAERDVQKNQISVYNAVFSVSTNKNNDDAYALTVENFRYLKDADKPHASVTAQVGKDKVDGETVLLTATGSKQYIFTFGDNTLVKPLDLLSESGASVYTIRFVSGKDVEKDPKTEKGKYLGAAYVNSTVELTAQGAAVAELSTPQFQFVISDVNVADKEITFTNRETGLNFVCQLAVTDEENQYVIVSSKKAEFKTAYLNDDEEIKYDSKKFLDKKIELASATVDKFAGFANRDENAGYTYIKFALDNEYDDNLYVQVKKDASNYKLGKATEELSDAALFELVKSEEPTLIRNSYVYKKDGVAETKVKGDTVAYYTYAIKWVNPELTKAYYLDGVSSNLVVNTKAENAKQYIVKNYKDGSVYITEELVTADNLLLSNQAIATDKKGNLSANVNVYTIKGNGPDDVKSYLMAEEFGASLSAEPQHIAFKAKDGGYLSMDENAEGMIAIKTAADEDLTFWLDTADAESTLPSFFISKGIKDSQERMFMYYAKDSSEYYINNKHYTFEDGKVKMVFKAGTLTNSDTLATTVNNKAVNVSVKKDLDGTLGGLNNFKFQIFKPNDAEDLYVLRCKANNLYVVNNNGHLTLSNNIKNALQVYAESQSAPTDNENVEVATVKVLAGNGNVTIAGAAGKKVVVSNILGQVVANTVVSSDNAVIAAPAGVVVVAVEGEAAVKAIVK